MAYNVLLVWFILFGFGGCFWFVVVAVVVFQEIY